jgi:hypothetical protein
MNYRHYGGRGISMCDRWANSFEAFVADMGKCPPHHSLGRLDNDGHYEPGNCCWQTQKEQLANTRRTVKLTLNGETMTQNEWAIRLGLKMGTIDYRRRHGWPVERVLSKHLTHPAKAQ